MQSLELQAIGPGLQSVLECCKTDLGKAADSHQNTGYPIDMQKHAVDHHVVTTLITL